MKGQILVDCKICIVCFLKSYRARGEIEIEKQTKEKDLRTNFVGLVI